MRAPISFSCCIYLSTQIYPGNAGTEHYSAMLWLLRKEFNPKKRIRESNKRDPISFTLKRGFFVGGSSWRVSTTQTTPKRRKDS